MTSHATNRVGSRFCIHASPRHRFFRENDFSCGRRNASATVELRRPIVLHPPTSLVTLYASSVADAYTLNSLAKDCRRHCACTRRRGSVEDSGVWSKSEHCLSAVARSQSDPFMGQDEISSRASHTHRMLVVGRATVGRISTVGGLLVGPLRSLRAGCARAHVQD